MLSFTFLIKHIEQKALSLHDLHFGNVLFFDKLRNRFIFGELIHISDSVSLQTNDRPRYSIIEKSIIKPHGSIAMEQSRAGVQEDFLGYLWQIHSIIALLFVEDFYGDVSDVHI